MHYYSSFQERGFYYIASSLTGWFTSPMLMEGFDGSDFSYPKRCLLGLAEQQTCEASTGAYIFFLNGVQIVMN